MAVASKVSPRHIRHRSRARVRRSGDMKKFIKDLQTALSGTGAAKTFTSTLNSKNITITAHGLLKGAGPFLASNSGGALPGLMASARLYWVVGVVDANNVQLAAEPEGAAITFGAAGTGTNTLTKASSLDAVFELLKKHGAPFMKAATDVDGI
jgi:hypothetical protein